MATTTRINHRGWRPAKISEMRTYASDFELLHCDNEVVKTWGGVRTRHEAGAQVPNNDCWIAACCVVHNLPLLTHDQDFKPLAAQGLTLL
jgi:toxin FitB